MQRVILDPFLLACPDPEQGREAALRFVNSILACRELREVGWIDALISEEAAELLFAGDYYPGWNRLKSIVRIAGVEHVQPKDVLSVISAILTKSRTFESWITLCDIHVKSHSCSPLDAFLNRPPAFIDELARLLLLILLARSLGRLEGWNGILFTRADFASFADVSVSGVVDFQVSEPDRLEYDYSIAQSIARICCSRVALHASVSALQLWLSANHDADTLHAAIRVLAIQVRPDLLEASDNMLRRWWFGPQFIKTAREHGFLDEPPKAQRLMRAIVETILGDNLTATHALRSSPGGGSEQLSRGDKKAWRRDVDYEYHLHYWVSPRGHELYSVVLHNDFSIS
ncbi:MAG: hypothetical protein ACREJC_22245 [Tepidisphaeraceae bacterium]